MQQGQQSISSQTVNLPDGVVLTRMGKRFLALVLDIVLFILTLVIGYVIWSLIIWDRGQSPGKHLTGIRVARVEDGGTADWGLMFKREFLLKFLLVSVLLSGPTGGIAWWIDNLWAFFDGDRQTLHDKVVHTVVVEDAALAEE